MPKHREWYIYYYTSFMRHLIITPDGWGTTNAVKSVTVRLIRESVSAQGREGRGFNSDPGRKKKGYILSRDSEVTLSHWSRSIELVTMPLIDL
jgi:hypothetical protein